MLKKVTFTGADDLTSVQDMVELSKEFDFIEWGILVGSNLSDTHFKPRFPSVNWIRELRNYQVNNASPLNLSLHVCGLPVGMILQGDSYPIAVIRGITLDYFQRVQLNFHGQNQEARKNEFLLSLIDFFATTEIIFQLDNVHNDLAYEANQLGLKVSGLFDLSHGTGVLPSEWPVITGSQFPFGYAGGLGPDNIAEQIELIHEASRGFDYWVDMETQVRTVSDAVDYFDLTKVRKVCEILKPWIKE